MQRRIADLIAGLRYMPSGRGWLRALVELAWAAPLMLLVAHLGGLVRLTPAPAFSTLAPLAASLLVAPALGEELLFRGLLIPRAPSRAAWMALSVVLFVLWHPLQALTFGPRWAGAFLEPWFLASVAILGIALARIYAATRSLWPCVLTHWAIVVAWKAFLGGPF